MIKYFLVTMLLLFVILGFLNLKPTPYNIDFFASSAYTDKGIPVTGAITNTAYITLNTPGYLWIYYDKKSTSKKYKIQAYRGSKYIGYVYNNRPITYEIKNFKPGDRVIIYSWSNGYNNRPTFITGHIHLNGQYYQTNPNNFKILSTYGWQGGFKKAGKRLGCFKDGGSRRLPYQVPGSHSHESCRYWSQRRGHPYYGLQYGGQCFTGTDLNKAKSYGKLNDSSCNMRGRDKSHSYWNKSPNFQILGGTWANDIYSTNEVPDIRDCGDSGGQAFVSNKGQKIIFLNNTRKLKPAIGPNCSHNDRTYAEFEFKPEINEQINFCPDDNYDEYNPAGCKNHESSYMCEQTPKINYKPDKSACVNKTNYHRSNYNNLDLFNLLRRTMTLFYKVPPQASRTNKKKIKLLKTDLMKSMSKDVKMACIITTHEDNSSLTECEFKNSAHNIGFYQEIIIRAFTMIENNKTMKTRKFKLIENTLQESVNNTTKIAVKLRGIITSLRNSCSCINANNKKLKCAPC